MYIYNIRREIQHRRLIFVNVQPQYGSHIFGFIMKRGSIWASWFMPSHGFVEPETYPRKLIIFLRISITLTKKNNTNTLYYWQFNLLLCVYVRVTVALNGFYRFPKCFIYVLDQYSIFTHSKSRLADCLRLYFPIIYAVYFFDNIRKVQRILLPF